MSAILVPAGAGLDHAVIQELINSNAQGSNGPGGYYVSKGRFAQAKLPSIQMIWCRILNRLSYIRGVSLSSQFVIVLIRPNPVDQW